MDLTSQGYYNLIVDVAEPEELHQLFQPIEPDEEFGRIDDVETALSFVNDTLDADNFQHLYEHADRTQELLMKGYILESIRFNILREDWKPMFDPLPYNPIEVYDPDVIVHNRDNGYNRTHLRVKLREIPSKLQPSKDPIYIFVIDKRSNDSYDYDFRINNLGVCVEGDELKHVMDEFHDKVSSQYRLEVGEELREKLSKLYHEASVQLGIQE